MNLLIGLAALIAYTSPAIPSLYGLTRSIPRRHYPKVIPAVVATIIVGALLWPIGLAYRRR